MKNRLVAFGIAGSFLSALCCFTPLLPIVLGGLGLTGLLGVVYKDAVLLPVLGIFLVLTGYGLWMRKAKE